MRNENAVDEMDFMNWLFLILRICWRSLVNCHL